MPTCKNEMNLPIWICDSPSTTLLSDTATQTRRSVCGRRRAEVKAATTVDNRRGITPLSVEQ